MSKILSSSLAILLFGYLSLTTLALSSTLDKNYFFVNPNNTLSQDLFQTRHGIIAHNIESINNTYVSRYTLLDLNSKEATPILADTVNACEFASPVFQHLHHHIQTDSLVYFCPKNTTLLIIDQSSYTVQTSISFNLLQGGPWPIAKLSTEGTNVAIVGMDTLFTTKTPKPSMLVKVDMQTKNVTTQILFNQGLMSSGEAVVAYISSKKGSYIATNEVQVNTTLATAIYSIATIGNTYQVTLLTIFSYISPFNVVTKLFCLGNYVVVNNGQDLFFIDRDGIVTPKAFLKLKSITTDQKGPFQASLTSQNDNNYLYVVSTRLSVDRYSAVESVIIVKSIGSHIGDIQVAYGNQTSGDLMFTLDNDNTNFTILDLQTLKKTYSAIPGYNDLVLTDTAYVIVKSDDLYGISEVFIFDLKTDILINSLLINPNYHLSTDQQIISYFNDTGSSGCLLEHVDLATGKVWTSRNLSQSNPICSGSIQSLRITENGNSELVALVNQSRVIISETFGQVPFLSTSSEDNDCANINFDTLSVYYLVANSKNNQTSISSYSYNPNSKAFALQNSTLFDNIPVQKDGFFIVNNNVTAALSPSSFTLFNKLDSPVSDSFPSDWNIASTFQDSEGNQYVLATYSNVDSPRGSSPGLYTIDGSVVSLPGLRAATVRAQAAGPKSYWLHDDVPSAFGLVRFYNAGNSNIDVHKTLISM